MPSKEPARAGALGRALYWERDGAEEMGPPFVCSPPTRHSIAAWAVTYLVLWECISVLFLFVSLHLPGGTAAATLKGIFRAVVCWFRRFLFWRHFQALRLGPLPGQLALSWFCVCLMNLPGGTTAATLKGIFRALVCLFRHFV